MGLCEYFNTYTLFYVYCIHLYTFIKCLKCSVFVDLPGGINRNTYILNNIIYSEIATKYLVLKIILQEILYISYFKL